MPWFMTVFGRDTLITSYQTLLFGPELARGALEVLADLQATDDDPSIDAEPGKIVHEVRHGKAAKVWFPRYYGTVDATPLYLVLLSEVWRWTRDDALVRRGCASRRSGALAWIDEYGDLDGDGFVESTAPDRARAREPVVEGLRRLAALRRRTACGYRRSHPSRCRGTSTTRSGAAAELAREVWDDPELAERLEAEAAELQQRFDEAFWIDERGGYYALALDADEAARRLAVLQHRAPALERDRPGRSGPSGRRGADGDGSLWSGWGVRTMSTDDAGYSPLSYHNGTVWPHDNSLIAAGLARYGRWEEALRIVRRMLEAAAFFDYELPEVFAGLPRGSTPFPIAYPTAARPQAWAAGTPVLLLQVLLGLAPDRERQSVETTVDDELPDWVGSLRLSGVPAFGRSWDVRLEDGHVAVERA